MTSIVQQAIDAGKHIWTWTDPKELAWLAEQATKRKNVVEIGSYMGRTAKLFALACPGPVICVDHFETAGVDAVFKHFLADEIDSGKVTLLQMESVDAARRWKELRHPPIDMIFIDGAHLYDDVAGDIKVWLPLVAKGGLICGHDYYIEKDGLNPVARAVHDHLQNVTRPCLSLWACQLP